LEAGQYHLLFSSIKIIPITGGSNSLVTIKVYDLFRKNMRTLVNNSSNPPGTYTTQWDGLDNKGIAVPSGLYIIEMQGYTPQTTILRITAIKE
jgi:flagellar hook assembly protein FlgD